MSDIKHPIYIGSILLEPNRHKPGKEPSFAVSEWLERFRQAGFDGVELWENHAKLAPAEEVAALAAGPLPIAVYNTYAGMGAGEQSQRDSALDMVRVLRAGGVKWNFGRDASQRDEELRNAARWSASLPEGTLPICECHPGTIAEEPAAAAELLGRLEPVPQRAIVHAFTAHERLREWFQRLGPMISLVHVQLRDAENRFLRLDRESRLVRETVDLLRELGFGGAFTLEFTEGCNTPDETMEALWENALRDLEFVRACLAG
jgi:sugar phosphate isomerase/epimerase